MARWPPATSVSSPRSEIECSEDAECDNERWDALCREEAVDDDLEFDRDLEGPASAEEVFMVKLDLV